MMKKAAYPLFYIFFALVFVSCTRNDNKDCLNEDPVSAKRTVLIYMAASNSLDPFGDDDIAEMEQGIVDVNDLANCNVLLYLQKGRGAKRKQPVLKKLIRSKEPGSSNYIGEWEDVKVYPKQNSVSVEVMEQVFTDAYTEFQANQYGLVLWSHADGWLEGTPQSNTRWYGEDQLDGNSYTMDIKDLNRALEKAPHLDFILFDCCLMQSVEVAYEIQDKADFMLGSPAEIPGPGAPYQKLIPILYQDKKYIVEDLASAYYKYYEETYTGSSSGNYPWEGGVSMTVLDLSHVASFARATKELLDRTDLNYLDLYSTDVFHYDPRIGGLRYYHDLYGVIESSISTITTWDASFKKLVVYYQTTATNYSGVAHKDFSMSGSHGISMYIPKNELNYESVNKYYENLAWSKYMMN